MSHLNAVILNSDAALRERLQRLLVEAGMQVKTFVSPLDFIDSIENVRVPDLLLADLVLDDIDGWRLCHLLRSPEFPDANALPILLTSSTFFDTDLARIARNLGANGCLSLPASDNAMLQAVRSCMDPLRPLPRTLVMVVGDAELQVMANVTLEGVGYEVTGAATLAEARILLEKRHPHAIVLDDAMPDGNTVDALAEWRELGHTLQTVCLMVTRAGGRGTAVEFARHGVECSLSKPFSPPLLVKALADALHARTLRGVEEILHQRTLCLHETERNFRDLYDKAPLGYHTIGPDGTILSMNATELQWLGYTIDEIVGRKTIFELQAKESAGRGRKVFETLKSDGAIHDVNLSMLRKNGTILPVSIEAKAAYNENNEFLLSRAIVRDLTDQIEKEAQIRQTQRAESMATLVEGVAHSFNNLLTPVLINAGELLESFAKGSEEREIVEEIVTASKRAAGMIRQLALMGRSHRPPYAPVDLAELIAESVGELRGTFKQDVTIETDIAPGPAVVTGNAGELKRALLALCFNARETMPTGGILKIALSRTPVHLPADETPASSPPADALSIAVSDTGPGVPQDIADRVFEPFFTTKPMSRHAGLGLSAAYSIMRNHGGRVALDPRESDGARFVLHFPAPQTPGPAPAPTPTRTEELPAKTAAPAHDNGATILIVDDDRNIRHTAARVLARAGYTVIEAEDGRTCLERVGETVAGRGANRRRIDLVVLDVVMPGLTCEEVLDALRPLRPDLPIVIATGHGDVARIQEFLDRGARRVISKPFEKVRLLRVVREVLTESAVSE